MTLMKPSIAKLTVGTTLFAACLAFGAIAPSVAQAETKKELLFSIYIPPRADLRKGHLEPWAKTITAGGEIVVKVPKSSVGSAKAQFAGLVQDAIQITVIPAGFLPKPMQIVAIGATPFSAVTSEGAAVASWKAWEEHISKVEAWKDFKLLSIVALSDSTIQSATKETVYNSVDAIKGRKITTAPGAQLAIFKALGASPQSASATARAELLGGGVVDANVMSPHATKRMGLDRFVKNAVTLPGLAKTIMVVFMKKSTFDGLPPATQKLIDETSGATLSRQIGKASDSDWKVGLKQLAEAGVEVHEASDKFLADLADKTSFLTDRWIAGANKAGLDGDAILKSYKANAAGFDAATN